MRALYATYLLVSVAGIGLTSVRPQTRQTPDPDIEQAIAEAAKSGKRVLVDVGGNWCGWCHEMERYFEEHADLRALRDKNFVTVKVNWSPENKNEAVLAKYPKISGYPHLFVLDKNGALLQSQDTAKLEDGKKSYDLEKFTTFLEEWAPPAK